MASPLLTTAGRWVIWASDLGGEGFFAGDLVNSFTRYGATSPSAWAGDAGNGFVTDATLLANVSASAATRVYDGTRNASVSAVFVAVGSGVSAALNSSAYALFDTKDVAIGPSGTPVAQTVRFYDDSHASPFQFSDSTDKPVYGVTVSSSISGLINPRPVTTSLDGFNKVYDGSTTATLTTAAVSGLVGSETLSITQRGEFSDKNVGTGKLVTVTEHLVGDGSGGGLARNYAVTTPLSVTADITPLALPLTGLAANGKIYDATIHATLSGKAHVASLSGDAVGVTIGEANFADKNVGEGKAVTLSGFALTGADAGNYSLQLPVSLTASITPLPLSLSGLVANNKVYDATTRATLGGTAVAGLAGDAVTFAAGEASFADKNVGQRKVVTLSGFALAGADAGNYSLTLPTGLSADISPAALTISGLTVAGKVYDGTRQATLGGTGAIAPLGSDEVSLGGSAQALFNDANVGAAKPVTVSGYTISGADASNYVLQPPVSLSASITPATLRYVAQPLQLFAGASLPTATGQVEGFVNGESQASATTGTLNFTLGASSSLDPAGRYGVAGGGLLASNYVFVQDPANALALTLLGENPAAVQNQAGTATLIQSLQTVTAPAPPASPLTSGLLDLTRPLLPIVAGMPGRAGGDIFGGVDVSSLSDAQLQGLLSARDNYKRALFSEATERLAKDPGLADLPGCVSVAAARLGNCLITPEIKRQAQAMQGEVSVGGQASVPAPAAPAAPAAQTSVPAPFVPPVAVAAAPVPAPVAPLFGKRRVKTAALPQIERKLALLIGVDRYTDTDIPLLGNAVGDARAVGGLFETQLGYETVLLPNASKQQVVSALNRLALELGPSDSVTIYYAGHGAVVDATGQGYWQLSDSNAKRPESWLSNADIARLISQISASQVALISDSCYSGTLVSGERIRVTPGKVDAGQVLARRSLVVMSSGGNEPVFDDGKQGHSPFAWSLMKQLGGLGNWQMGGNVFERVRFAVARELPQRPQYGTIAGHQTGGDYLFEQRQLDVRP